MICNKCGKEFPASQVIDGKRFEGRNRKFCFECCPKGQRIKWHSEEFINKIKEAISKCDSVAEVLKTLNLRMAGGNYATIKHVIKDHNIDTSHFTRKKNNLHKYTAKYNLEQILVENFSYNSDKLRKRLIKEGLFEAKCYKCNNTEWMGQSIPLELEHINGKHDDNRIENLTILCPNCHAQTKFYRGKNKKSS